MGLRSSPAINRPGNAQQHEDETDDKIDLRVFHGVSPAFQECLVKRYHRTPHTSKGGRIPGTIALGLAFLRRAHDNPLS